MAALANKIGNYPVLLPLLDILNSQRRHFGAPQTSAQENGERGIVSLATKTANVYGLQKTLSLGYRVTTVLLKASLGSEQYHSMNSLIAWS
jgi:hypothetical protein